MTAPMYAMRDHVNRPQGNKSNRPAQKPKARGLKRIVAWLVKLILGLLLASILSVVLLRFIDPPMWTWRIERALFPPAPVTEVRHQWRSLEQISPELQLAVIAAEDQKFASHTGFDLAAISSAIEYNQKGNKVRGASTLSQQAAKNLLDRKSVV